MVAKTRDDVRGFLKRTSLIPQEVYLRETTRFDHGLHYSGDRSAPDEVARMQRAMRNMNAALRLKPRGELNANAEAEPRMQQAGAPADGEDDPTRTSSPAAMQARGEANDEDDQMQVATQQPPQRMAATATQAGNDEGPETAAENTPQDAERDAEPATPMQLLSEAEPQQEQQAPADPAAASTPERSTDDVSEDERMRSDSDTFPQPKPTWLSDSEEPMDEMRFRARSEAQQRTLDKVQAQALNTGGADGEVEEEEENQQPQQEEQQQVTAEGDAKPRHIAAAALEPTPAAASDDAHWNAQDFAEQQAEAPAANQSPEGDAQEMRFRERATATATVTTAAAATSATRASLADRLRMRLAAARPQSLSGDDDDPLAKVARGVAEARRLSRSVQLVDSAQSVARTTGEDVFRASEVSALQDTPEARREAALSEESKVAHYLAREHESMRRLFAALRRPMQMVQHDVDMNYEH
jgi:hypothetical protein